jgi:hypothetical protein
VNITPWRRGEAVVMQMDHDEIDFGDYEDFK